MGRFESRQVGLFWPGKFGSERIGEGKMVGEDWEGSLMVASGCERTGIGWEKRTGIGWEKRRGDRRGGNN